MLLPVAAVSAVGASIEKPIVATAEISGLQTAATPLAVLSNTINASVEGKLNMLLVAARERMLDSLLSAIDAASQVVNVSREPGENNAAYAQRVAAAIRSLTPQQLVVAQQRMDTQTNMRVPLPLLAEALEDPEAPQAVQLALSLEQATAAEPDAVLKAVVNSYGQNAGRMEVSVPQVPASTPLQRAADLATLAMALAAAAEEPLPSTVTITITTMAAQPVSVPMPFAAQSATLPLQTPQPDVPTQSASVAAQPAPSQPIAQSPAAAAPQATVVDGGGIAAGPPPASQLASLVDDLAVGILLGAIADEADLPTEIGLIRSPLTPRDIQQIQADIKEGLQVVISPPAMATGSDLQQIISNPASSVEKIIAQALTANMTTQSPSQPPSIDASARSSASALASPASLPESTEALATATVLSGRPQSSVTASMAMYETAEQAGMSTPLPLGVPFVVANYLPADVPVKNSQSKLLDRVDPVDDEEGGDAQGEEAAQQQDKDEAQAEETAPKAAEEASDEADAGLISPPLDEAGPEQLALPQPLRDPLHDHAFDFYRRMVAWE
ncbi:hypothetical protein HGP16_29370 [Rhizobium sp. P40RR-XXII]|uniref:hypothetical protein n=1 Tax=Rhizobium sp. P40RR-XXII TaxID=2726739 RepID=UPI001456836E|nr:hypothetical protein [Rhizobium sp. P40RR-XXII]NLS20628.1 hypothetical protein [Rhizobium sp. P40RR-XXII]